MKQFGRCYGGLTVSSLLLWPYRPRTQLGPDLEATLGTIYFIESCYIFALFCSSVVDWRFSDSVSKVLVNGWLRAFPFFVTVVMQLILTEF